MGISEQNRVVEDVANASAASASMSFTVDAVLPDAIARAAEDVGVKKAHLPASTIFALAILGGAFISIGGLFYTIVLSGADGAVPYGLQRLLGGLVFSAGLVLVTVAGAQLFTSDCLLVMGWASGRITTREAFRVWVLVWFGNLVGSLGTAIMVFLSGWYGFGHGITGATALYIASLKANLPSDQVFFLAILCNALVCLGTWMGLAGRSATDKILGIIFPISCFVAAGFEHCIANQYLVPLGMIIEWFAPESFWAQVSHGAAYSMPPIPLGHALQNLAVATAGNWVGGALLVGGIYWMIYRRGARAG
jgi:formate transporter